MNVVILAEFEIHPDDIESAIAGAINVVNATQKDAGCFRYAFARDVVRPNVIRISEHWESVETLRAHLTQPHVATFVQLLGKLRMLGSESKQFTISAIGEVGS